MNDCSNQNFIAKKILIWLLIGFFKPTDTTDMIKFNDELFDQKIFFKLSKILEIFMTMIIDNL